MTKQEIVDQVSNATGLTKVETETIMRWYNVNYNSVIG